ncbi:hemerythrin [Prescottella equi]|uniref:Hemerythrin-like domain-containing protein n=1 Tax=Prescottella equi ATCC 33707 TaxID=525370 RepID=F1TJC1_RHOHA|nr:hypothetical protein HMPREF0724_11994 [Prescottella equi ATCC 33707]BCN49375.1 hemerythrin [Prescottella equi]BCN79092.1 hemerythrin [Prescottella equi]BDE59630.1 hemerythrin [Prescottella equi]
MGVVNALTFLRAEHESVLGMLEVLEGSGPGSPGRDDMVANLVVAESRHEAIEQEVFWPIVRDAVPGGDELADTAIGQEMDGEKLLDTIEHGSAGDEDYESALREFLSAAREHIEYEQKQVWPLVTEAVSASDLEDAGNRLEAARKRAPTRPHPNTPPRPAVLKTTGAMAAAVDKVRDVLSGRGRHHPPETPPS